MSFATLPPMTPTQDVLYYLPGGAHKDAVIYANWPDGFAHPSADQQVKLIDQFESDRIVRCTVEEIMEVLGSDIFADTLTA